MNQQVMQHFHLPSQFQIGQKVHVHAHGWLGRIGRVIGVTFLCTDDVCKVMYDVEDDRGGSTDRVDSDDIEGVTHEPA